MILKLYGKEETANENLTKWALRPFNAIFKMLSSENVLQK